MDTSPRPERVLVRLDLLGQERGTAEGRRDLRRVVRDKVREGYGHKEEPDPEACRGRGAGVGGEARVKGTRGAGALGDAEVEEEGGEKRDKKDEAQDEGDDDAGAGDIVGVDAEWRRREGRRA